MTSLERAAPPVAWAEPPPAVRFLLDAWTVAQGELRKIAHDPTELLTRAVQPVLWLLVFGQVLAQARAIPTGSLGYMISSPPASSRRARSSQRSSSASR